MFQPPCGIFQPRKCLPLRYAPLEIELELADVLDPIVGEFSLETDPHATQLKARNTPTNWKIENCGVKLDSCTLDNTLGNSYTPRFMGGKTINIVCHTFTATL